MKCTYNYCLPFLQNLPRCYIFERLQQKHRRFCSHSTSERRQTFWAGAEWAGTRQGAGEQLGRVHKIRTWNEEIMLSKWKSTLLDKERKETPFHGGVPSGYPRKLRMQWSQNNVLFLQQKETGMQKMSLLNRSLLSPLVVQTWTFSSRLQSTVWQN